MSPPFKALRCSDEPGLPHPDGHFDLIYAMSVYTHLTGHWAGWLLEHRRVLADDGLLLVSFLGEGMIKTLIGEDWNEDHIGMNVLWAGKSWEAGGPVAFHSPWWLRAHWGRAFEIISLLPHTGEATPEGHGLILARRKDVHLSAGDLERIEPGENREITALEHQVRQLHDETLSFASREPEAAGVGLVAAHCPLRTAKRIVAR
jgi:SAM-dependent methyltransferase